MQMTLLLAKTETVLLGMIDRQTAIDKCYGIEMDFEKKKTKVMRTSRLLSPTQITIDKKTPGERGIYILFR